MKIIIDNMRWLYLALFIIACKDSESPLPASTIKEFPYPYQTTAIINPDLENIEPAYNYDFVLPVEFDAWNEEDYNPRKGVLYFRDIYGPRELSDEFDNHAGVDIVHTGTSNGETFGDENLPTLVSMCDGTIYRIDKGNKCSVYVECDQVFSGTPDWGKMRLIYRHNSQILVAEGAKVKKGDAVAVMGNCDANKPHLHLSLLPAENNNGRNVITARAFNPLSSPYLQFLTSAEIVLLRWSPTETIIRIAIPGNMIAIREFKVVDSSQQKEWVYDTEKVISIADGSAERDDPSFVPGIEIYAYSFNGEKSACELYRDNKGDLPAQFPGSALRDASNVFEISCDGIAGGVALVYDVIITAQVEDPANLAITVSDVYGRAVQTL